MNKKASEVRLFGPRRVPLTPGQERAAVALLGELLLDAAAKRRGLQSVGALDSFRWRYRRRRSVSGRGWEDA
jgi:hypothetical protein